MQIELLEAAQAELDQAIEFYARESAGLGDEFLAEVLVTLERITDHPHAWPHIIKANMSLPKRRFPYGVIYLISMERTLIVAIAHMHRKRWYRKSRLDSRHPGSDQK